MKNWLINLFFKSLTVDNISQIAARCVVWLLEYARNKGDKYWDTAKGVIRKINNWCSLFLEVYEDDELSEEDEEKIAEAIKNQTDVQTIANILQKKIVKKRGGTKKKRNAKAEKKGVKRVAKKLEEEKEKPMMEID